MSSRQWTIFVESQAPAKPVWGAACNGCGVCCLVEPCPLGMVLSRRRRGACSALRWDASAAAYQCGALVQPREVLAAAMPPLLLRLLPWLPKVLRALAPRWIAAGKGCDSSLQPDGSTIARPDGAP